MRLFYLLYLFFPTGLFAQLHISPSGAGVSYLFVNSELLYVDKEIHLEKNPAGPTEASLYLRREAQLLQGGKPANTNSGDGMISVFQEGTSNAYDYNYWALPVVTKGNQAFGASIYEPQDLTESKMAAITAQLNGSANPLTISRRWIYKYAGQDYEDWQFVGQEFDVSPGEGFIMKGVNGTNLNIVAEVETNPGNRQRYDFRGIPNDGDIEVDIGKDKAVLIGNPYPSALHLKSFLLENPNSTGIAYFWDSKENGNSHHLKDYEGGYGAYSPGANTYAPAVFKKYNGAGEEIATTADYGERYGREYSPIGQGFMLLGKANGKVIFRNRHRVFRKENPSDSQFKFPVKRELSEAKIPLLRLNVEIADTYIRQLVLAWREDAGIGADWAMDAENFGELDTDASWLIGDRNYVINVRPFSPNAKIPLNLKLSQRSEVSFSIASLENFSLEEVFIFDAENNMYHNLKQEAYKLTLDKGKLNDRFFLSFTGDHNVRNEKEEEEEIYSATGNVEVFQNNAEALLEIKFPEDLVINEINLYDLNGSLIFSKVPERSKNSFKTSTSSLRDAIYIVKLFPADKDPIIRKISIKN